MTYAVPLKVTIRLVVWNKDPETGVKTIRDIKEQEVYFGDIPLMTENGTFIINGTERVIVSQLHRSPGAFFHSEDKTLYIAQIIPYRGSWVEFEYDTKNLLYVRIDRKRKFLASVFLRALGLRGADEIIRAFYNVDKLHPEGRLDLLGRRRQPRRPPRGARHRRAGRELHRAVGQEDHEERGRSAQARQRRSRRDLGRRARRRVRGRRRRRSVHGRSDPRGERAARAARHLDGAGEERRSHRHLLPGEGRSRSASSARRSRRTRSTRTKKRSSRSTGACVRAIRRRSTASRSLFENMFFNQQKYDFSRVGRLKLNTKLGLNTPLDERILHPQDFYDVLKYLLKLRRNPANVDDIDHLGNRRVRSVGELLENQFRIGLVRMERAIKEKMSVYQEMATAMPHDLINAKPVMAAIREFFGSSQLSPVHGPDQPALRDHAQAASLGARAGRSVARARGIRGPRRPPDALRTYLPD